jgi:Surface-adhesin protein E
VNRVKAFPVRPGVILVVVGLAVLAHAEVRGDDWVFYGGSREQGVKESALRDWYVSNRLRPLPKNEATAYHYYDRDSIASNYPYSSGGIVRVWEKYVFQRETKTYEEARVEIEKEEEKRLKRKINVLDYGWLFPFAANRATKEVTTLYEINCDTGEFFILELNQYDKAERRMTRETNMEMTLWVPIRPETMLELLCKQVCQ